jgi:hypothetical protein
MDAFFEKYGEDPWMFNNQGDPVVELAATTDAGLEVSFRIARNQEAIEVTCPRAVSGGTDLSAVVAQARRDLADAEAQQAALRDQHIGALVLLDGGVPVFVLIIEVQLDIKLRKRFTWPHYTMGLRARHGCPVGLLVVAPDPDVAAWCAQPIKTGIPGFVLTPPVLGRAAVPVVTDPAEAARRPELGVLSAMAHGASEQGAAIAAAVLPVVRALDDDRARFYGDLVLDSLNEAARRALETMMKGYEYQSDFAKKYYGQGRDEGEATARARDVLTVLRVRGITVPDTARERILAEKDPARLARWVERSILAASVAEVMDEPS